MKLVFKLFNSIKAEHEAKALARLELEGLLSQFSDCARIQEIHNFAEAAMKTPLKKFKEAKFELPSPEAGETGEIAVFDCLLHELPYGEIQGYTVNLPNEVDLSQLVLRLGYTKEIFAILETSSPQKTLQALFPKAVEHVNAQYVSKGKFTLYRFITHQYFLEKSQYISKLSRYEQEIDRNVNTLFRYLTYQFYRIPASSTMRVGKRLEDYFAIREEPSLYLTHYMHPYKGKFHPKMIRALLNYVLPEHKGTVLDNFAGSGTLLVEAVLMGLDAYGVDINPLSALMTHVKCDSLRNIKPTQLKKTCASYLEKLGERYNALTMEAKGQQTLTEYNQSDKVSPKKAEDAERIAQLQPFVGKLLKNGDPLAVEKFLIAQGLIQDIDNVHIRDFLLLALSGSISDAVRRTKADFLDILSGRIGDLYRRIYLFYKLNETLKIQVGKATSFEGDTRRMRQIRVIRDLANPQHQDEFRDIKNEEMDAIVNSPPYSTALDYIKNDEPQLRILNIHPSLEELKEDMMGCPRVNFDSNELQRQITENTDEFSSLPEKAKTTIRSLIDAGRRPQALRSYKFFLDMRASLQEMKRVTKPGGKNAIVIGNNHYRLDDKPFVVENDAILEQIAEMIEFERDPAVQRELEKSSAGAIRQESILLLTKK